MNTKTLSLKMILGLSLAASLPSAAQSLNEEAQHQQNDEARVFGYKNFGPAFYNPSWDYYPVERPNFPFNALTEHRIPLKAGTRLNPGADQTGWVPVPFHGNKVYYRAQYHIKDFNGFDMKKLFLTADAYYNQKSKQGVHSQWNRDDDWTLLQGGRSKLQMVVFPMDEFHFKYYPGSALMMNQNGSIKGDRLAQPRGGLPASRYYSHVEPDEVNLLAGLFKGTFDNVDCVRHGRLPGLIVNGRVIDPPLDELATFAIYRDGSIKIGRYSELSHEGIVSLRQNEFPLLEKGQLALDGAYPMGWNRAPDDILRTYFFMSEDGKYVGYAWVNFSHPSYVANALKAMGFAEAMHLDIHPAVGAGLANPSNSLAEVKPFFKGGSYDFIPWEKRVLDWGASIADFAKGAPMQWPYTWPDQYGSSADFLAVFGNN